MKIRTNFSLKALNSLNVSAITPEILFPSTIEELSEIACEKTIKCYVLGDGSNTLFCDTQAPIIIKPNLKGINIVESKEHFEISVACGENWHEFVLFCIANSMYGLENLALIPGSVGAAPVQNIGAYGIEVGDFIHHISWYDFTERKLRCYTQVECQFGYRNSIFKQALNGKGIITHVHFLLAKSWQPVNSYQGLNEITVPVTPQKIMAKVIQLRAAKLPDPKQLPNAGSFFKNPIVNVDFFNALQLQYPGIPFYQQSNGDIKLAAGWLIEHTGLKGYRQQGVGVHENQALVLINYDNSSGQEIVALAAFIQEKVMTKFNIHLEPEVRFIGCDGELPHASLEDK